MLHVTLQTGVHVLGGPQYRDASFARGQTYEVGRRGYGGFAYAHQDILRHTGVRRPFGIVRCWPSHRAPPLLQHVRLRFIAVDCLQVLFEALLVCGTTG